jgi:hypothetical protein
VSDPLPTEPEAPRHLRRRVARTKTQRVVLAVFAGLAAAAFVLVLDGLWAGRTMFRGVAEARSALTEGAVAVVTGDPAAARAFFEHAAEAANSTVAATSHPSIELAERLPWLGDNIKAVEAVALASEQSAGAGLAMVDAAVILGWQDVRIPATESLGAVDLRALRAATPKLDEVAKGLGIAEAKLSAADTGRLVGPIATGYQDALEALRRRYKIANQTRDIAHLLPGFLGAGGSRTYLMAVQTLGLPQGTGGRVDLIGALVAERGRLTMDGLLVQAGPAYAAANVTPDGPSTAQELLRIASASGLGELDGVVLIDSVWLRDALWVTGQLDVPGRRQPLTMDDAADVLERQVFEVTNVTEAESTRARLANAIVEAYLERRPSTEAFAIGSATDASQRHLILYSAKPKEQVILERLEVAGVYDPGANPLSVTWRALVDNHAILFARRSVSHTVTLTSNGGARVRTVIELVNQSPLDSPSVLLGLPLPATVPEPAGVNPVGGWAGEVQVTLPSDATRITAETSVPSETEVVREQGRQYALATLATDPGAQMTLIVTYTLEHATPKDTQEFRMLVFPQATLDAGVVRIKIDVPSGSSISEASEAMQVAGSSGRFVGDPTEPLALWVRW